MDIPPLPPVEIHQTFENRGYVKQPNLAQYKGSDFSGAVRLERNISLDEAFAIASEDERIDYFVYVKAPIMLLELSENGDFDPESDPLNMIRKILLPKEDGQMIEEYCRVFGLGDVIFFNNED